jgi:putative GTP pyrophosphokinase
MPKKKKLSAEEILINELVELYKSKIHYFEITAKTFSSMFELNPDLRPLVHSVKSRTKDPDHLRDKLFRKLSAANIAGKSFSITADNLFEELTDLCGIRLIHLHMSQFPFIHRAVKRILDDDYAEIIEGPIANTWDVEYEKMFNDWGATAIKRESMYTSVHYIIDTKRKEPIRFELQVRTLMEEVWGEVSHTVNYPHPTTDEIVKEQLKVLARFTSGCTRLVDTIFYGK